MGVSSTFHRRRLVAVAACFFCEISSTIVVNASNAFDWSPSVSLTENFGVDEGLCIDIAGFGGSLDCGEILQLHTCNERGDDTQFFLDETTNQIRAVNYNYRCDEIPNRVEEQNACVTIESMNEGGNLGLAACSNDGTLQGFEYVSTDGTIRASANTELCLAKTSDVGPAGANERTDLALADCQTADASNIVWTVVPSGDIVSASDNTDDADDADDADMCGSNTCEIGEVCCNESCGICAPPGGACTEEYCCPTPSEDVFCDYRYAPVVCADGCEYDNKCFAEAAGHEVGTCGDVNCPTPSDNVVCPYLSAPITCVDGCEYDNDCLAEAAGQDINTCNAIVGPECGPNICEIGEVCCNESCGICAPPGGDCTEEYCCPTPSEDVFCDNRYAPVVCADGCEYDNKCFAEAAGHEVGTCGGVNCPTPSDNVVCPYLYAPITCIDGCEYDNDCLAEAAGQDINTCNAIIGPECGTNTCEIGEVCCNESCGICAPPGGACTEEYCSDGDNEGSPPSSASSFLLSSSLPLLLRMHAASGVFALISILLISICL